MMTGVGVVVSVRPAWVPAIAFFRSHLWRMTGGGGS